jgi:hypothetical protein
MRGFVSLACLIGMIACASAISIGACAAEIPEKYRGVYGDDCEIPESESDIGEFPWLIITKDEVHGHETTCSVKAVRRNVKRNVDELTFSCAGEGDDLGIHKELWSLEVQTKQIWEFKISQPYLVTQSSSSAPELRKKKCALRGIYSPQDFVTPGTSP